VLFLYEMDCCCDCDLVHDADQQSALNSVYVSGCLLLDVITYIESCKSAECAPTYSHVSQHQFNLTCRQVRGVTAGEAELTPSFKSGG
jgi:hypothetical protein